MSLQLGQFGNEVEGDYFKGFRIWFGCDGYQWGASGSCVDLVSLAFHTSLDVFDNICLQPWPPAIPFDQSSGT